jgi:L-amino acid N-acyltransferase YncA
VAVRLARPGDAAGVVGIYAPIVAGTAASFEVDPPDAAAMAARIAGTLARLPWLVDERGGGLAGYAYASQHRDRAAYRWSVDVSVYVAAAARGAGVGRGLYGPLLTLLAAQGFVNAYAGITLPNPASVRLHEGFGFAPVGVYRAVGFKLGAWWDVGWWALRLRDAGGAPPPPVALAAMAEGAVGRALAAGTA